MKKIALLSLVVSVFSVGVLVGCNEQKPAQDPTSATGAAAPDMSAAPATTAAPATSAPK